LLTCLIKIYIQATEIRYAVEDIIIRAAISKERRTNNNNIFILPTLPLVFAQFVSSQRDVSKYRIFQSKQFRRYRIDTFFSKVSMTEHPIFDMSAIFGEFRYFHVNKYDPRNLFVAYDLYTDLRDPLSKH